MQTSFSGNFRKNKNIQQLYRKIRKGGATFRDAQRFAEEAGKELSAAYDKAISSAVLPDGKMYYNIANRVIRPTLAQNFALAAKVAGMVQESLNQKAGLGMKALVPEVERDRIDGFINRISSEDNFDDVKWILGAPVETFTVNAVDQTIEDNAAFQAKAGVGAKVVRTCVSKCCDWCESLAGTYYYPDVPKEVYQRHNNCHCIVEYYPGDGRVQNVHSKRWRDAGAIDRIEKSDRQALTGEELGRVRRERISGAIALENGKNKAIIITERDALNSQSSAQISKGIRSLRDRIAEHDRKIANPAQFCTGWDDYNEQKKAGMIKHWKKEIATFEESIDRRVIILKERGDYHGE